ncbi:MAG: redox-regulated ATPase YchF [Flavobacteriales bacterium]|jgi:GTP-binding protein YchF|tara:strand:- start:62 stop:1159 length:1098 start_codon:yes stop_codon:yes gene_type:complete
MALQCGIVGLPNVGKSTLFNCLSKAKAQSANYPFCTIEPNVGIITVPDDRMDRLAELVSPEKVQPTTVEIVDIAGLVKGASKGEGLGNKFLANIRETNAIIHVLRCFEDDNIVHVDGSVDPVRDKETIDFELQIKDLETITKIRDKNIRTAKSGNKDAQKIVSSLEKYITHLESGQSARSLDATEGDLDVISDLHLLTAKPILYVCNVDENTMKSGNIHVDAVRELVKDEDAEILLIATAIESEIADLEDFEEQQMFLEEMGLEKPGVHHLIQATYKLLNLQTYFTAGVKEVRAWTITKGMKAPQAAGVIHTDFEKGFIRAEVIAYNDFDTLESEQSCKEAGKMKVQGKDYIVEDGDVMHFLFNV